MTYRSISSDDLVGLDPGGQGEGDMHYNVVEAVVVVSQCQSNNSALWGLTWPVCSTRFTSLLALVMVTALLAIITLATILGNVLVLCALYRYRCLRTMSNCLIGNLAVSDLLLAITVLPISTANDVLGYWVFGRTMCTIWLSIDVLYCTASIWGLCTIAFDRYTATVYPMWYHEKRSPKKALTYMLFVWIFSIIISLAPFIGWQDMISGFYIHDPAINRHMCILFSSQSYVIYSAMGSFILPSCFMTFLYVQIFVVLHRQSQQLKKKASINSEMFCMEDDRPCPANPDSRYMVTRDFTVSSFVGEETFIYRDREHQLEDEDEEEEEEEREEVRKDKVEGCESSELSSTTGFCLDRNEAKRQDRMSARVVLGVHVPRHQRSNSLSVTQLGSFNRDSGLLPLPRKDLLAVSACDIPLRVQANKNRSAAFSRQNTVPNGTQAASTPLLSQTVSRSKSTSRLCDKELSGEELENGHTSRPHVHIERLSAVWPGKRKNYSMTISMRRRFQQREQRATKRMLLIMACFFVCWVPFTLMYMLRSLCQRCKHLDDHVTAFIIWLGYVNSSLNPLLYTLFNDDFRKAFKKLLGIYRPRQSSQTE